MPVDPLRLNSGVARPSPESELPLFARLKRFLLVFGIPGLFLVSLLDSAAVPMAGGPDAVLLLLSWHRPGMAWLIAAAATVGSTSGCLILYRIGAAGGELALARFSESRRAWVRDKLDRSAFWAVFASVTMPPPFPTKLIILASGVFRLHLIRFLSGVLTGRILRYGIEAYLGARFGEQGPALLEGRLTLVVAGIAAAAAVAFLVSRYRQKARP